MSDIILEPAPQSVLVAPESRKWRRNTAVHIKAGVEKDNISYGG